jgi:hypothetical protein
MPALEHDGTLAAATGATANSEATVATAAMNVAAHLNRDLAVDMKILRESWTHAGTQRQDPESAAPRAA